MKTTLLLACAGKGARAGFNKNKLLVDFDGTVLEKTLNVFIDSKLIDDYVVVVSSEDQSFVADTLPPFVKVVAGGQTRTDSVKNALAIVEDGIVLIHDGARPFVDKDIIARAIESVKKYGSALTAFPSRNTICLSDGELVKDYLGKSELYSVQTPQAFFAKDIKKAYELAGDKVFNDDGEVYKTYIGDLHLVLGSAKNVKLTFKEDFEKLAPSEYRFGTGFDCHRLVENRRLVLGGITIPHDKGLLGHSDADVLAHAVMDAILSALSLRDIGYHFSDKDPKYKDADSMKLLDIVLDMIKEKGYKVDSVSACIMAEKPKLLCHIPTITENLAKALGVSENKVGISATTLEGLGFVGREEGICTHATATLKRI